MRVLGLAAWAGLAGFAGAGEAPQSPEVVVRTFVDAENARSIEGLLAMTADILDVRLYNPDGTIQFEKARTRPEQRASFTEALRLNPDSRFRILSLIASGPVVITRDEVIGLPGGARGIALTAYRVFNGRIAELWILNSEPVQYPAAPAAPAAPLEPPPAPPPPAP